MIGFYENWIRITNDKKVLSYVSGLKIPFLSAPLQVSVPREPTRSDKETIILSDCVSKLLSSGAISAVKPCKGQFISNVFTVPKSDGSYRLVINLKYLNQFVKAEHFKLEDQKTVARVLHHNVYLATLDLKDAYFLVPVALSDRKYLRFTFRDHFYEFSCLPFGLNCAPLIFTKLLKPVLAFLRNQHLMSVVYLDDFLLLGNSYKECLDNISFTINTLENLGFLINYQKSMLEPTHKCQYLGFVYNSIDLTISLPDKKTSALLKFITSFFKLRRCVIRDFAKLIGKLVSICPAVRYGWLHLKSFERARFLALRHSNDNYNDIMEIPTSLSNEFRWWLARIPLAVNTLKTPNFLLEIFTDASLIGWGAHCAGASSHGPWSQEERKMHINYLELKAAFFGIKCFAVNLRNTNILLRIDNTTAIAYINKMGGVRFQYLNRLCYEIWQWCEERNLYIFASYIKSSENIEADFASRHLSLETEWELNVNYFDQITNSFYKPDIDLFASRINRKCKKFISWHRDPEAYSVDSFTLNWRELNFYAFPPFAMILKTLQKIINDGATGIVVVPRWPTQPWYPIFYSLLTRVPIILHPNINLLLSTDRLTPHPLWPQLTLVVGVLSGRPSA